MYPAWSPKYKKARVTKTELLQQTEQINSPTIRIAENSVRRLLHNEAHPDNFKPVVQVILTGSVEFVDNNSNYCVWFMCLAISDGEFIANRALVNLGLHDHIISEGILSNYSCIRLESYHLQEMEGKTVIMITELTVLHNLHYTFGSPVWYNGKELVPQDIRPVRNHFK